MKIKALTLLMGTLIVTIISSFAIAETATTDPLPSWTDTATKQRIITFVGQSTDPESNHFIAQKDRIATFDNDGTLWSEQPAYFQFFFIIDRIKTLAPQHPEWKTEEPFTSALSGDMKKLMSGGQAGLLKLIVATHAGITDREFTELVQSWLKTHKHPTTHQSYTDMTYQPMVELLTYLQDNGYVTYIVSGGGTEFMRAWAETAYNIPANQIIGSSMKKEYKVVDGKPEIVRTELNQINDGPVKPVSISHVVGKRPVIAFGNSDGDREMLEWCNTGQASCLAGLIHHTDAEREWAYDKDSHIGKLDKALSQAKKDNWLVVDMKNDWNTIFKVSGTKFTPE